MLHISIKAEEVFEIFGFPITNSQLAAFIVLLILFALSYYYYSESSKDKKSFLFYLMHSFVKGIYNLFHGVVGNKIGVFFPILGALFFYILTQNWFGLLPGVGSIILETESHGEYHSVPILRAASADLNMTLALGIFAVIAIQVYGFAFLGFAGYISKFINLKGPIDFFLGILEIVSEFSRVISFSFRLFGNIFAGEVLIAVIAFLVPVLVSFPFLMMEIFVGFIQALVFAMLTAVFLQIATAKHH